MQKVLILSGYFFSDEVLIPEPFNLTLKKQSLMKKFMFVLAIAAFAACNNGGSEKAAADSTAAKMDSTSKMSDSTSKMTDTTNKMAADTTAKKDTTTKK
ncbi:MAG TPA: hypothetical protein VL978_13520 [Puia sp.]|nr:hypothetical protein [Puia sp.]